MLSDELKPPKDIEIKFYRLNSPSLNTTTIPLSGLYNPFDNNESEEYSLNNKLKNFDVSPNQIFNIENLLSINTNFGKIFPNEQLEGLLTLTNISDHEVIIKDLKITVKNEDKLESKKRSKEKPLEIELPNNSVSIPPNKAHSIKIKSQLKFASKYTIETDYHTRSSNYDKNYYKMRQRTMVKENGNNYTVIGGIVEFFNNKKLFFEPINPFKINEIFHNSEVNNCLIEIRIYNPTSFTLNICDLFLTPKRNKNERIKKFKKIEEIKNFSNDSRHLMLQTEEQITLLFQIDNPDIFYDEDKFILNLYWSKDFDFIPKLFKYEFNNNLNTYNDYYKMVVIEKQKGDIILNKNFKILINIKSKNTKEKYIISLSQEPIRDKDKTNDREIEIIDIIEKKMELNSKTPSNNFILICKSDVLGNVYLPRLKFSLYVGDKNNPIESIYNKLLDFNCITKETNNINE